MYRTCHCQVDLGPAIPVRSCGASPHFLSGNITMIQIREPFAEATAFPARDTECNTRVCLCDSRLRTKRNKATTLLFDKHCDSVLNVELNMKGGAEVANYMYWYGIHQFCQIGSDRRASQHLLVTCSSNCASRWQHGLVSAQWGRAGGERA